MLKYFWSSFLVEINKEWTQTYKWVAKTTKANRNDWYTSRITSKWRASKEKERRSKEEIYWNVRIILIEILQQNRHE